MKYFFFVLISTFCLAQNPDGNTISIHISPFLDWGSNQFEYSASNLAGTSKYTFQPADNPQYPTTTNFQLVIKIPTSPSFTLSMFYKYSDFKYKNAVVYQADKIRVETNGIGLFQQFGATLSFYTGIKTY